MDKNAYFSRILFGIWWLACFWIVANMNMVISVWLQTDIYPKWAFLKDALRVWWPIIFWLIRLFVEIEFIDNKDIWSTICRLDSFIKENLNQHIYKCLKFFLRLLKLIIVIILIGLCFYVYHNFIQKWLNL